MFLGFTFCPKCLLVAHADAELTWRAGRAAITVWAVSAGFSAPATWTRRDPTAPNAHRRAADQSTRRTRKDRRARPAEQAYDEVIREPTTSHT